MEPSLVEFLWGDLGSPLLFEELSERNEAEQLYWVRRQKEADYGALIRVALRNFPLIENGEDIRVGEIKERLGEIREAGKKVGFPVAGYSDMRKAPAWEYLMSVQKQVRELGSMHCPDALQKILSDNDFSERTSDLYN